MTRLYLAITRDKYELPIAVADSAKELAQMVGVQESSIRTIISKYEHGRVGNSRYRRVFLEDEDSE